MKRMALLLGAVLLAFALGGCAAEDADYTEYNGVKIPNEDIENADIIYYYGPAFEPDSEELLQALARQQVQLDEAERLGIMPSKAAAAANYQEQVVKPVMQRLGSNDPTEHEQAVSVLMMWQEERQRRGLLHDEFCDYLISHYHKSLGMKALHKYVWEQSGLPLNEWSSYVYYEYVDELLAQAASAAAGN